MQAERHARLFRNGSNQALRKFASIPRALGLTLVTGNMREFARVPGIVAEDWLAPT